MVACGLSAINPRCSPRRSFNECWPSGVFKRRVLFLWGKGFHFVAKVIETVDEERRSIGKALGYELMPVGKHFMPQDLVHRGIFGRP
ncbi:MAG: hypothetical protein CM1200mP3_07380 [Chloroflexota bacterium]|nr:MAG: hypothetical protein CM1200mP3_07380 [Chloroflexota bacterium]